MAIPVEIPLNIVSVLLVATGVVTPTMDHVFKKKVSGYITLGSVSLSFALNMVLLSSAYAASPTVLYGGALKVDFYGAFLSTVATAGALLVLVASMAEVSEWSTAPSYYSLVSVTLPGVYYIVFANDVVLLFVAWVLVSVASYALVGIRKDESSLEGASKYAMMGVMASSLMLYGIALVFGLTGFTQFQAIARAAAAIKQEPLLLAGVVILIASFGFKMGVVPFHGWLPDVYGGVHPILVSYVAGVIKMVGVLALLRFIYPFAPVFGNVWLAIFATLSIATMSFGNIVALVQRNVQRMMAYSSIAHAGYILLGFAAATGAGQAFGVQGIALHLVTYMLANVGIFVALAYLMRRGVKTDLEGLRGLGRAMPITSISVAILVLSLIGVPPLLGFWSKFTYLFLSTIDVAPWLTLIAVVNSAISVGYYIQVIRYMFFIEGSVEVREKLMDPELVVVVVAAFFTVLLGLGLAPIIASSLTLH